MGNITELSQGSLNGLRRQLNECIENAYNKGYADGKKEPNEEHEEYIRDLINKAKQEGYDIGLEIGKKQAISEIPEVANKENEMYNKGLEDASNLLAYADERFIRECFPSESNWDLFDLNAKYGLAVLIKEFKKWQEQKKQAEEEIKVGDEVKDLATDNIGVVIAIGNLVVYITDNGVYTNTLGSLEKTGRHFEIVNELLNQLRGNEDEND